MCSLVTDRTLARNPLAWRLSVAKIIGQSPIENHHGDVPGFVKVPGDVNVRLMKKKVPPREFKREPDDHSNQQVDAVSELAFARRLPVETRRAILHAYLREGETGVSPLSTAESSG
jgi:hypothetical protein